MNLSNNKGTVLAIASVAVVAAVWMMRSGREPESGSGARAPGESPRKEQILKRLTELGERRPADREDFAQPSAMRGPASRLPAVPGRPRRVAPPADTQDDSEVDPEDKATLEALKQTVLTATDPKKRVKAVWLLGTLDDKERFPVLQQALSDHDAEVRLAAVQELSGLGEDTPLDLVAQALDDPDPEVRLEALNIVDEVADDTDDSRTRPLIDKALNDPDEDVRSTAEDLAGIESPDTDTDVE